MRVLSAYEINLVAGGWGTGREDERQKENEIVVTGHRDGFDFGEQYDPIGDTWEPFFHENDSGEYFGGGGGQSAASGNGLTDEQRDDALTVIESARALLQQAIEKYGAGTMADINGRILPAWQLLEHLGTLMNVLQAGNLIWSLENGTKGLADAIGFIAAIAAVGVAGELGIGVGAAALLGVAVEKLVTSGSMQVNAVTGTVTEIVREEIDEVVQNNPGPDFNPMDPDAWFDGLFGIPHQDRPVLAPLP
ncbi:hypothetical protein [Sphingomonas sp. NPDC049708]|uniref:hypothetical protein n=1 Tax=unclassified Sphingomonas TaxID=196159 RepID=UPI0029F0DFDD|nr:hypothetical protein [Pseudomonadota bacterium]